MNPLEHYITLALESAGIKLNPAMTHEIQGLERNIIDQAKRELHYEMRSYHPDFKGD